MRKAVARAALAIAAVALPAGPLAAPPILIPGDSRPASVDALGPLEGVEAFGLSGDSALAAGAFPSTRDLQRSVLRIARAGESPREVNLPGSAVALLVASAGDAVLVVVRELGRKGEILGVRLVRIDTGTLKATDSAPLPATTRGIAFRGGGDAILTASRDEVRTFLLPALTSGPLFRVLGDNRGVAPLAGSSRLLVAQAARLVVIDVTSPQTREGLPIVDQAALSGPPRSVTSSPDEPAALLLQEDGTVSRVEVDPLRVDPAGRAVAIAWPGVPPAPAPAPPEPSPAVPEAVTVAAAPAPPSPPTEPLPPPAPEVAAAQPVASAPPPAPEAPAIALPSGSLSGRIDGTAAAEVIALAALGPDNILKEAARVPPSPDGRWRIDGLPPGSYRVVALGEGGRVLICDPPYLSAKVGPEAGTESPVMHVLRAAR